MILLRILPLLLWATHATAPAAEPREIAKAGAWTWFNDERSLVLPSGVLFCGYVKPGGEVALTRYDPSSGEGREVILGDQSSIERDDHNNPALVLRPDGRLLAVFSLHHTQERFLQRTSKVPDPKGLDDWGPLVEVKVPARNTYANLFRLSDEDDRLFLFHRCIGWNPNLSLSEDLGKTWSKPVEWIRAGNSSVRPYVRLSSDSRGRIDLIYTDGHPRQIDNSVYHMFYHDGALRATDGSQLSTLAELPLDHDGGRRGSTIYRFSKEEWGEDDTPNDWIPGARAWVWDVHLDAEGRPVCVFQVQRDHVTGDSWSDDRIYYYYARWNGEDWDRHFIAQGGRGLYHRERDYGGGMTIDPADPSVVYLSSNAAKPFQLDDIEDVPLSTDERYEIYRGVTADGGRSFEWTPVTRDSPEDNLRPIVPPADEGKAPLLWLRGEYRSYVDFSTRVVGFFPSAE